MFDSLHDRFGLPASNWSIVVRLSVHTIQLEPPPLSCSYIKRLQVESRTEVALVQSIMASPLVLLLHLLLVSLGSASHNFGGLVTYSYKGKDPDGAFNVSTRLIRSR